MEAVPSKRLLRRRAIFELVLFPMLGALMFCSKLIMEVLPNIHLLGMFTVTYTLVFRKKALIPIYIYVFLNGLYAGFASWWVPYLYIWTLLWGAAMLVPKKTPKKLKCIILPLLCGLHGLLFGILYAPAQAVMFGMTFKMTIAWVVAGFPWDVLHAAGNLAAGCLTFPLSLMMERILKKTGLY